MQLALKGSVFAAFALLAIGCAANPDTDKAAHGESYLEGAEQPEEPAAPAPGEPTYHTRVLRDATTSTVLKLATDTVRCSAQGYGQFELKISVPDLDWLAYFDHRVEDEGQPCMTGGACTADFRPADIIDAEEPFVTAPIRVVLTELLEVRPNDRTCTRSLEETVTTTVRGHAFAHFRASEPTPVDYATCLELLKL